MKDVNWIKTLKCDWYSFKISYPEATLFKALYLPDFKVVFIFRLSQLCSRWLIFRPFAYLLVILNDFLHGVWISFKVEVGGGVFMGHPRGLVVHPNTKIGINLSLIHQVTFGGDGIIVGDYVEIHSGAKIINSKSEVRKLYVGNGAVIGASALVLNNVPENAVVIGIPSKIIKTHEPNNNWYTRKVERYNKIRG